MFPLLLHVSIAVTVIKPWRACFIYLGVRRIDLGTYCMVQRTQCLGLPGSYIALPTSTLNLTTACQLYLPSFGLSKSQFLWSQFWMLEIFSSPCSSSLFVGWRLILLFGFNKWVRPPERSFADNAVGKGHLPYNLNTAAAICGNLAQDNWTISSVSEMYPIAVICLVWEWGSVCIACRFWLHCYISNKLWTLAIVCNFRSSASLSIATLFSVSMLSSIV